MAVAAGIYRSATCSVRADTTFVYRFERPFAVGLGDARVAGRSRAGGILLVSRAIVSLAIRALAGAVAGFANCAWLAVVAGLALIGGLGFALIGDVVADAEVALIGLRRAVTRVACMTDAAVAGLVHGAEQTVVAAQALIGGLGFALVGDVVADAEVALIGLRRAVARVACMTDAAVAGLVHGAVQAVVAGLALIGGLGFALVCLLYTSPSPRD